MLNDKGASFNMDAMTNVKHNYGFVASSTKSKEHLSIQHVMAARHYW